MLESGRCSVPDALLPGCDASLTALFYPLGSSVPITSHPARSVASSPVAPPANNTAVRPHRLLAAPTQHRTALLAHLPRHPRLLPRVPDHRGPLNSGSKLRTTRCLSSEIRLVVSLNSIWASSSPLLAPGRCPVNSTLP
jgi:hypothetical protein